MLYFYYLILCLFSPTTEYEEVNCVTNYDTLKVKATYYYSGIHTCLDFGIGEGSTVTYKGKKIRLYLRPETINSISVEGFAILVCNTESLSGTFLINDSYQVQSYIKGSKENKLKEGDLAVDNDYIPYGSKFFVKEFNKHCTARDVGSGIKGMNRVDVYLGVGDYNTMRKKANAMPETLTLIVKKTTVRVDSKV